MQSNSAIIAPASPTRSNCVIVWLSGVWAFLCHTLQILLYSNALPRDDQWDSEGYLLFKPWVEGKLAFAQMYAPHNEHRIFFKRIFDLLFFALNADFWDNRVIAIANALIYGAVIAVLAALTRKSADKTTRRVLLAAVLAIPLLLVNSENTLWGFQSQFYFLLLFTLLGLKLASTQRLTSRAALGILGISVAALGTIASGFLLAPVAAAMVMVPLPQDRHARTKRWLLCAALGAVTIVGYLIIPKLAAHEPLHAHALREFIDSTLKVLAWPVPMIPLAWLATVVWIGLTLRDRRQPSATDLVFLGMAAWVMLQAVAIGYGRGHELPVIPSRYTDSLILGLVANLYFACGIAARTRAIATPQRRLAMRGAIAITATTVSACLALAALDGVREANESRSTWQSQVIATQALLQGAPINAGEYPLPYPNPIRFTMLIADPTMRDLLHVDANGLPAACDAQRIGPLSRLVCAAARSSTATSPRTFETVDATSLTGDVAKCNLDDFFGSPSATNPSRDTPLRFRGWVGREKNYLAAIFSRPRIVLLGETLDYAVEASAVRRPDVSNAFGSLGYYWSGLDVVTSLIGVAPGDYEIAMQDRDSAPCRTGKHVHVR